MIPRKKKSFINVFESGRVSRHHALMSILIMLFKDTCMYNFVKYLVITGCTYWFALRSVHLTGLQHY